MRRRLPKWRKKSGRTIRMTLATWNVSVRLAKIKLGKDPKGFTKIQGKLLKEAQIIYHILLLNKNKNNN